MQITILGSGTRVPDGRRGPSGYAVECGDTTLLVDGGTGTLRRLAEAGIDYRAIDHLLYTHVHPDHTGDLVPFLFAHRHTPGYRRTRPLRIFGPRGFTAFFEQVMAVYGRWVRSDEYAFEVRELWGDGVTIGPLGVETRRMRHSVACVGYRLTGPGGATAAYTGDTDVTDQVSELARSADVLLAECSMPDERKLDGHLTPGHVGRLAAAAGTRLVVLTHLYPECAGADLIGQCRRHFAGEIALAHDLMQLEVSAGAVRIARTEPQVWPIGWASPPGERHEGRPAG